MSSESVQPVEIDLERTKQLRIRWADGHESQIPLVTLRKACPCAGCRAQRHEEARDSGQLRVFADDHDEQAMVTAAGAELVGTYALRICWSDGHDTGIYDFGLLRELG